MRHSLLVLSGCLAVLALGACDRTQTAESTTPVAPDSATPAATDAASGDSVSMRYACDDNYQVSVMGDTVRVTRQDGTDVELSRVAGEQPPLFSGEAMEFSVTDVGAVLTQDEGGTFSCREAEDPMN